jgi:DNA-binding beta-propeller fold protein YncE
VPERIKLVQGDTLPQLQLVLTQENTGTAIDLTGATVTLHFRATGGTSVLFSRAAVVAAQTAASGVAVISWQANDLDQPAGDYEGEIEIYWAATGARQTVFQLLTFRLREDLA